MPSKKDTQFLADLRAASTRLTKAGAPELAATVDSLLLPNGWSRLRHAMESDNADPNLAVHMPLVLRAAIQDAAKAAGDSLPSAVAAGIEEFIAGRFSPSAGAHRARRNTGLATGNLNVRVSADLRARFQDAVTAREKELEYAPALGHVVKAWLIEKYDIPAVDKLAQA
ncbi:hypothetical protein [Streptomyces sp. NPDC056069]|uniref:hypothetical protein n=1 Tax=Streptomyces sp. NPDC056069 TaxID=3345702 RepID=UPI0035DBD1C1